MEWEKVIYIFFFFALISVTTKARFLYQHSAALLFIAGSIKDTRGVLIEL